MPPTPIKLNNRQQHVLWATVRQYVATARPVGSEALLEEFNLNVSSATIRNAMGRLEKAGLLYQPHTSAGRIPSDSGYRIYVDQLLKPSDTMGRQVEQLLSAQLNWEDWSLEALLRGAAQLLSQLSGYITLITLPRSKASVLRHLQLVLMEPRQVMVIVVFDTYETESTLMDLPILNEDSIDTEMLERELQILSNFLNHHLRGRSLQEINTLDWSELGRELERYANRLHDSLGEIRRRTQHQLGMPQLLVSGVAEVLRRQPEFAELQQVQMILQLLEEDQDQLLPLIFEEEPADADRGSYPNVSIRIGTENPLEPMQTCTLVSAIYHRGDNAVGSIGILGPTRMMYEDTISLVEATAHHLSEAIR
ncbi:MAG: heat-inducible transcriptional repressor HrcA [Synechococcales bacterium]|nr:heat-inducible transcriptional repressor HrcA [Synechococcales bacterium]